MNFLAIYLVCLQLHKYGTNKQCVGAWAVLVPLILQSGLGRSCLTRSRSMLRLIFRSLSCTTAHLSEPSSISRDPLTPLALLWEAQWDTSPSSLHRMQVFPFGFKLFIVLNEWPYQFKEIKTWSKKIQKQRLYCKKVWKYEEKKLKWSIYLMNVITKDALNAPRCCRNNW